MLLQTTFLSTLLLASSSVTASPYPKRATCIVSSQGDAAKNDAPAINTALKTCGAGGSVVLPANTTYTISSPIDFSPCRACEVQLNGILKVTPDWDLWYDKDAVVSLSNITAGVISSNSPTSLIDGQNFGLSEGSLLPFSNIKLIGISGSSQLHMRNLRIKNVPGTTIGISGASTALRFQGLTFENEVRRAYEIQDSSHVYVWNHTMRAGEVCVRILPNASNVQVEDSVCMIKGTLNAGGRVSGVELTFGSSALTQWVRNVFVKRVKFVGAMDAVSLKSGANKQIQAEVYNTTFSDISLDGPVTRPVYLGAGDFGDMGCGETKCTKWNVTDVLLKSFAGSATEKTALVCESTSDVCEFKIEGWNVTYT